MTPRLDILVVSPHLDDAVFSCGGSLRRWVLGGLHVAVATPFAAEQRPFSPWAEELHRAWGFDADADVMAARRAEDRRALESLGCSCLHGDLPDALYRRAGDRTLYDDLPSLRSPVPDTDTVRPSLDAFLHQLPEADRTLLPLAVGGHVDHRLVHERGQLWVRERETQVWFYEDFPYAQSFGNRIKALAAARLFRHRSEPLGAELVAAKVAAAECYGSQLLGPLAEGGLARELRRFAQRRGGERFWMRRRWAS